MLTVPRPLDLKAGPRHGPKIIQKSPQSPRSPRSPKTPKSPNKGRMQLARSSSSFFKPTCEYHIPAAGSNWRRLISRWSDKNVSLPGVVVDPASEDDVVAATNYAAANEMVLMPASGGHGTFVPIGKNTLYLDMRKFDHVTIDHFKGSVAIGGGASTGKVLEDCAKQGFYTLTPNSNEVGMIGAFLGGGSNAFNGRHGFTIDQVISIRLVTGSGNIVEVGPESEGEEKVLFNALCGGGHGLGIITTLTLRAFPIKGLQMDNDKIWVRKLIFPPEGVKAAAQLYEKLLSHPKEMGLVMGFIRAPPGSPRHGSPMIIFTVEFFGPSGKAKEAAAATFDANLIKETIVDEVEYVPLEHMNDTHEQLNQHGGYKEMYSSLTEKVTAQSLQKCFDRWLKLGEEVEDAKQHSYYIFSSWDTGALAENGKVHPDKFFNARDKGVLCQAVVWYTKRESQMLTDSFGDDIEAIAREEGLRPASFANNLREGIDLKEVYSEDQLVELRRIKELWDPTEIFWSPATHADDWRLNMD